MWIRCWGLLLCGVFLGASGLEAAKPTGTPGITLSVPTSATAGTQVTVTVTPINGATPGWVAITTDRDVDVGHLTAPTFNMQWTVPPTLKGTITLLAIAGDPANNIGYQASATMQVGVSATLQSLSVTGLDQILGPGQILMNYYQETRGLIVHGLYSDGVTRDLSSSASGTVVTSMNTAIAQILTDGSVQAVGDGSVLVVATNSGMSVSVPVSITFVQPTWGNYEGNGGNNNGNANLALTYSGPITFGTQTMPMTNTGTITLPSHAAQVSFVFHNNSGLLQLGSVPAIVAGNVSSSSTAGCAVSFQTNLLPSPMPPYAVQDGTVLVTLPPKGGKCVVSLKIASQSDAVADKFTITNPAP